jgi:hypothetical protein
MNTQKKISGFVTLALLLTTTFAFTAPANASGKGWRYWAYYQAAPNAKTWTAAMTGPTVDVQDGAVEGWSFVFDTSDVPTIAPSIKPDFASICRRVKADKNLKRIALVVDFGRSAFAPKGEKVQKSFTKCVQIAKSAQGIDVLGQAVKIRAANSGLICGINGYPAEECGVEIPTPYALKK